MANKIKVGLDYFPCEVTIFNDLKVRKLMRYHSGRALPIYLYLLCTIYNNGYYMLWDKDLPFVISESLPGYTEGYISEVINCCLDVDLFSKELWDNHKILSSKGIQERYIEIRKLLKRKTEITQYCIISSEEMANSSEDINNSSEELLKTSEEFPQKKRKEKKRKEREDSEPAKAARKPNQYFLELLEIFKTEYKESRGFEFDTGSENKELAAIGKLSQGFREKNPNTDTAGAKNFFRDYFRKCLSIEDNFLKKAMSPSLILNQKHQINAIIQGGTNGQKRNQQQAKAGVDLSYFGIK